jgi:hypothetical protein
MEWVVGVGMFLGLLAMAEGTAAIRTGWTSPWPRRRVIPPRIYGLGAALTGVPLVVQGLFYFRIVPSPSWDYHFLGTNALMLVGIILMGAGQMRSSRRRS